MGWRFNKRIRIAPGITMNLGKKGPSFSFGPKGLKYTLGPQGTRKSFGIPGTGLYYTTSKKWGQSPHSNIYSSSSNQPIFLSKFFLNEEEKNFLEGMRLFSIGDTHGAFQIFQTYSQGNDFSFMAGYIAYGNDDFSKAESQLTPCIANMERLGIISDRIQRDIELIFDITSHIDAPIMIESRGMLLLLSKVYDKLNQYCNAYAIYEALLKEFPEDKIILLSFLAHASISSIILPNQLVDLVNETKKIENEEPIDTNILLLRSYLLYKLNMKDAALDQLALITRKSKNRPETLILDIRYLRGRIFDEIGEKSKAQKDYQHIFGKDPSFKDVKSRIITF